MDGAGNYFQMFFKFWRKKSPEATQAYFVVIKSVRESDRKYVQDQCPSEL